MVEKIKSNGKRVLTWMLMALIYAVPVFVVQGAFDAFIKFDGVDGESADKDHKGWIEVLSFSQGIVRQSTAAAGPAGSVRRAGTTQLKDLQVAKSLDKSSPKLAEAVCKGKVFPKVEIHMTRPAADGSSRATFLKYELKNVLVSSYEATGSTQGSQSRPTEELSLNFTEIKWTYTEYDAQGAKKGDVEASWKVEEGTK